MRLDVEGAVRGIGGDIAEEGFAGILLDKAQALTEEYVGAVAGVGGGYAVVVVGVVEIVVAPGIAGIADAAPSVIDGLVEAALVGAVGLRVT